MSDAPFGIGVRIEGRRHILTIAGEIDLLARDALEEVIDAAIEAGAAEIEFDMRPTTFCGSVCLAVLIHARRLDVQVFIRPSERVRQLLDVTGLSQDKALGITILETG